jgi:transposase-like protein
MAVVPVPCPQCQSIAVVKYGTQPNGTSRYRCQHPDCARHICLLAYQERLPEVRGRMVDLTLSGRGVRDIARVLGVSSATVIDTLKNRRQPSSP